MDLQPKLSLRRLRPKYNDLGLGRDMAWYACPGGLLVNSFNLSKICIVIFFLFFLSTLQPYVPHPHVPSWSEMTEWSIERKIGTAEVYLLLKKSGALLPATKTNLSNSLP